MIVCDIASMVDHVSLTELGRVIVHGGGRLFIHPQLQSAAVDPSQSIPSVALNAHIVVAMPKVELTEAFLSYCKAQGAPVVHSTFIKATVQRQDGKWELHGHHF